MLCYVYEHIAIDLTKNTARVQLSLEIKRTEF